MRGTRIVALSVGLAALVAGCGGDDGGDGSATTAPRVSAQELASAVCAARPVAGPLRITAPELNELSGLVALSGDLWGHNDSGDEARVFRIDDQGGVQATVRIDGLTAVDWEDMAGGGPESGELFVGDIGDNAGNRPEVSVIRLTLPGPEPVGEVAVAAADALVITLRYPDGPRDAESLLVDPVSRDLVIVEKRYGEPSAVYEAAEGDWSDGEATLERVGAVDLGAAPTDAPTAADLSADGRVVGLRTYTGLRVFAREDDQSVAQAIVENDGCDAPLAVEAQGETLAFTPDGYTTIGEGNRPRINRFTVTPPAPAPAAGE